ncbi:TPA_exp: Uncharacterized protein A8136_6879 [Trichophyton benhamiae CBS 112371]|uniref:Cyclin domain protein n=1 Tax=Arthroderma benhamiae (strain ATCC MYA-4681 / CBS 112371) TaxID=663331 RepID=D4AS81_ARTBC|nr:uncharacterized protein ARB_07096 [Trichophyton benhamiae CBS 112371]EFE34145.1 hypothetical protein ARB_07096 [Trichophyton benhamiae CBS 112371]DAA77113.1 TPA_exp: Uncharacterized protein A8136_6879 [Trichophyton benhamiae CBS 112371]
MNTAQEVMSGAESELGHLSNALASPAQLEHSSSSLDGVPGELERSVRYAGVRLTQAAGVLLQLPQDVIAQAIVVFTRFWVGPEGGSLAVYSAKDVSAAALYMTAKLSFYPVSPRSVLNVYTYLLSPTASPLPFVNPEGAPEQPEPESYYLSEGSYQIERQNLMKIESAVLRTASFHTRVVLPHTIALTYLQTLKVSSSSVAARTFAHLNAALFSPQILYLTHQPNALAVAAIYLAAREQGVKIVDSEWWEVFDVDREELGFLVVAMRSMDGFARAEHEYWKGKVVPLTVGGVEREASRRQQAASAES